MKRQFILIIFTLFSISVFAQPWNMPTTGSTTVTVTDGSSGTFYDDGGAASDYSNSVESNILFCPTDATTHYITISFTSFNIECFWDELSYVQDYATDGDASASNRDDYFSCTTSPDDLVSTSSDGCISLFFDSGGGGTDPGWEATVTSQALPASPSPLCASMNPLCSGTPQEFSANTTGDAEAGNNYGCLSTTPRPSWFYLQVETGGDLELEINNLVDLDYALWGPYANVSAAGAACGSLPAPVDCSYSATTTPEVASVTGVTAGEVYVLLVTAYSATPTTFTITEGAGMSSTTNCTILNCTSDIGADASSDVAYCFGETPSTIGADAATDYTGFDAGPNATATAGVALVEICGATWDSATYPDPNDDPNATGFLVGQGYAYATGTSAGLDGEGTNCDYITLVPMTYIEFDGTSYLTDPTCFETGTPFVIDFRPEITASYDCGGDLTIAGGAQDDGNPVAGEYTIAGDVTGTTTGGVFATGGLADGTYSIDVTDSDGCMQTAISIVVSCPPVGALCGTNVATGICYSAISAEELIYADVCPDDPADIVSITFTAGTMETCCDELSVYEGAAGSGNTGSLIHDLSESDGDLTGTTVTATAAGLCLQVYIDSDGSITCSSLGGVSAAFDVTCTPPPPPPAPMPTGCDESGGSFCYSQTSTVIPVAVDLCPDDPMSEITVTFDAGQVEDTYDELEVYSGAMGSGTGGTNLYDATGAAGDLTGLSFTSAAPGECLSLYIDSDVSITCSSSGYTPITITTTCTPPLPVELLSFDGFEEGKANKLVWETASEQNNSHFEVERSVDGDNFRTVGIVEGNGNSTTVIAYDFLDVNPAVVSYYRLKQVDFDGTFDYSGTILIKRNNDGISFGNVFPSPTKGMTTIQLVSSVDTDIRLNVVDVAGRLLSSDNINVNEGLNTTSLDLSSYPSGVYFFSIESDSYSDIRKVIKN